MSTESDPSPAPRPAPPGYRYASQWIRLLAFIIDGVVLAAIIVFLFIVVGGAFYAAFPRAAESALTSINSNSWPAGLVTYLATSVVMLAWYGGWQAGVGATPGMLALRLRVRGPSGEDDPSLRAAVIRNSPQVLAAFGEFSGNNGIDLLLGIVTLIVYSAIGITIAESPTRQGFHDRLAGGTYVVRPGAPLESLTRPQEEV